MLVRVAVKTIRVKVNGDFQWGSRTGKANSGMSDAGRLIVPAKCSAFSRATDSERSEREMLLGTI